MKPEHCIDVCNSLLRGERSAVQTYEDAVEKFGDQPGITELSRIRDEHARATLMLEQNVRSMGGQPDTDSGAWGRFASAVQQAASLLGSNSALEALQAGEKSGKKSYETALEDEGVMPECKNMIQSTLLPRVNEHIGTLERLQPAT
jgi:uncharacterized protein (TIGR02284 family)